MLPVNFDLIFANSNDLAHDSDPFRCTHRWFSTIFPLLSEFRWFWNDLIQILTMFWCVLGMCLVFLSYTFHNFYRKATISIDFPRLQYRIFRQIRCFWSVTCVSFRFFRVLHVLTTFWGIAYGTLEFRWCLFADFSGFERVSMPLDGSDQDFSTVLMRSRCVFGIFTVHFSRFLAEINDFDRFS